MDARAEIDPGPSKHPTTIERKSDRELVVTRTINGSARMVYEAFTRSELFEQWWVPRSCGLSLLSCALDVHVGGEYRLVFRIDDAQSMAVFGKYVEVTPHSRLAWTNDEGEDAGPITTVTFEERGDTTLLVLHELYPTQEGLDGVLSSGEKTTLGETFDQLEELLLASALRG